MLGASRCVPRLYGANVELLYKLVGATTTADLLSRLGFVAHPKAGLVHWLPPGLAILNRVELIVRKNMDNTQFEEVSLLLLSHNELWKRLGRWQLLLELFKLSGDEYLVVPTAEEDITDYVALLITSYKQLPLRYYQINQKFRNELRPRGGLLRGKAFMMKDAYSFDASEENAMKTYDQVVELYHRIFKELKVPYVVANADLGDIGGNLSHEWHISHSTGEDTVFTCDSCGHTSNIEKTTSYPEEATDVNDVAVHYFGTTDKQTVVCAYYPASRKLDANLVKLEVPDIDLNWTDQDAIVAHFTAEEGLLSRKVVRMMDLRLTLRSNFPDFPFPFVNRINITMLTDVPIVSAEAGEICGQCEDGILQASKAIEIGHTFYLGTKYLEPMGCEIDIPDSTGKSVRQPLYMGCYGIGLLRIIAAVAEINRDEHGLRWPAALAPWSLTVVEAGKDSSAYADFYKDLDEAGINYRIDNRAKVGIGRKINDSNMMGIPLVAILGKHYPTVEVEVRGKRLLELWQDVYASGEFDWDVTYDDNGKDTKHMVHKRGFAKVVAALLHDM